MNKNLEHYIKVVGCIFSIKKTYLLFLQEIFKFKNKEIKGLIHLNKRNKDVIAENLGVTNGRVNCIIAELKKFGYIIPADRAYYTENKEIFKDLDKFLKNEDDKQILTIIFENDNIKFV